MEETKEKFTLIEKIKLLIYCFVNKLTGFICFLFCVPFLLIFPFLFLIGVTFHFLLAFCSDIDFIIKNKQVDFINRNILKRNFFKSLFIEIKSGIKEGDIIYRKYFEI